jgi:hypothetical protein
LSDFAQRVLFAFVKQIRFEFLEKRA